MKSVLDSITIENDTKDTVYELQVKILRAVQESIDLFNEQYPTRTIDYTLQRNQISMSASRQYIEISFDEPLIELPVNYQLFTNILHQHLLSKYDINIITISTKLQHNQ